MGASGDKVYVRKLYKSQSFNRLRFSPTHPMNRLPPGYHDARGGLRSVGGICSMSFKLSIAAAAAVAALALAACSKEETTVEAPAPAVVETPAPAAEAAPAPAEEAAPVDPAAAPAADAAAPAAEAPAETH
jgi:hypothetical protein